MTVDDMILKTSHGVSELCFVMQIYASYFVFQPFSHKALCDDDNEDMQGLRGREPIHVAREERSQEHGGRRNGFIFQFDTRGRRTTASVSRVEVAMPDVEHGGPEIEAPEQLQMSLAVCIWLLIVVTVLVAVTAEFLIDSVDGLTATGSISKEFVGVILLPIVGNAAEHVTALERCCWFKYSNRARCDSVHCAAVNPSTSYSLKWFHIHRDPWSDYGPATDASL
ncbi:hypothetical protein K503DRAFT_777604 [Rhizopogon vinicolor AM-OR11-026]|uniref:Sodium/calcium exchanger membrane region domain-containing protein n=1 Tax=Rhizopogon vinicolor AM-OR11-026 TaxID=1314800 RepID=A0A1B7MFP0_9AGAM|nr:hypothetical protein K503DRAFT_777604 [Rhizopogon vinicolor AM-OR11-026]